MHLLEDGKVDQAFGGFLVFADVGRSEFRRVGGRVLGIMPTGPHPVEPADYPPHGRVKLRANRLGHGEVTATSRRTQALVLQDGSERLAGAIVGEGIASRRVRVADCER